MPGEPDPRSKVAALVDLLGPKLGLAKGAAAATGTLALDKDRAKILLELLARFRSATTNILQRAGDQGGRAGRELAERRLNELPINPFAIVERGDEVRPLIGRTAREAAPLPRSQGKVQIGMHGDIPEEDIMAEGFIDALANVRSQAIRLTRVGGRFLSADDQQRIASIIEAIEDAAPAFSKRLPLQFPNIEQTRRAGRTVLRARRASAPKPPSVKR